MKLIDNALVRGVLAGAIATVPMTLLMTRLFRELPRNQQSEPLPPGQIVTELEHKLGTHPNRRDHEALTSVAHFGYGAFCGVIYSLALSRWKARPALKGSLFGLTVWAASYLGFLPAAQLLTSATHHPKERNGLMILAHLVWGVSLAKLATAPPRQLVSQVLLGVKAQGANAKYVNQILA